MYYAKVNGSELIKFPYTPGDFKEENPFTAINPKKTLPEMYDGTEEALDTGNEVVEVVEAEMPASVEAGYTWVATENPVLEEDQWIIKWVSESLSEEDIARQEAILANPEVTL
jgi:hypothetical protein